MSMRRTTAIALIAAILLLIAGLFRGGLLQVFVNASLLCFSCIGIG
jgi:hypothetical protein